MYICLNAYYLITLLLLVVWLCVYLFKCLLPYYLITTSGMTAHVYISLTLITLLSYYYEWHGCVYICLNAYYLITLLLLYCSCVYICLNAYYLITLLPMVE